MQERLDQALKDSLKQRSDLAQDRRNYEAKLEASEQLNEDRLQLIQDLQQRAEALEGKVAGQRELTARQDGELGFLRSLYEDEKRERREITDRVFVASGFKEETRVEVGVKVTNKNNDDAWDALNPHQRTRSQIKRDLEERAQKILKTNKEREEKAVNEGKLAEVVSIDEKR